MPTTEQILNGLRVIANEWQALSILWHFYFALIAVVLFCGEHPEKRIIALFLTIPLMSVSAVAWLSRNPFNGIIYSIISILMVWFSISNLKKGKVNLTKGWLLISGIVMIVFGWIYPHFLEPGSFFRYISEAPIGIIPCPTLSIIIGFVLVMNGFESKAVSLTLGLTGLFFGFTGMIQLHVYIDFILLLGALLLIVQPYIPKKGLGTSVINITNKDMSAWGVGPKIACITVAYFIAALTTHLTSSEIIAAITYDPEVFVIAGSLIASFGILIWVLGAVRIDKAFNEGKLLSTGVYSLVRNPMYSGLSIFLPVGIAIIFRSLPLLSVPLVSYLAIRLLIPKEEKYLLEKFGDAYATYRSKVNAVIPIPKLELTNYKAG